MIRAVYNFFKGPKHIPWPKVDSCSEVQGFIDAMCVEYEVPPIKVIIKPKWWMDWFAGEGVSGCAFWNPRENMTERYIVFNGETCRISANDRSTPIIIHYRYQVVVKIHTIIHEFIHHYFHHHHGMHTGDHCKIFRKMEKQMNAEYGIYYIYNRENYGMFFHNFWGWIYGESKPSAKDRGWLA